MKKQGLFVALVLAVFLVGTGTVAAQTNSGTVTNVSPLEGNYSYQLNLVNGTNKVYVQDNSPNFETTYRAKFLFKINGMTLDSTQKRVTIFLGRQDLGGGTRITVMRLMVIRTVNFGYIGRLAVRKNDSYAAPWQNCGDWTWPTATGPASVREVQVEWKAATGPGTNDGYCRTTVNGNVKKTVTDIDNNERSLDQVWMGVTEGNIAAAAGQPMFDSFESYRTLAP